MANKRETKVATREQDPTVRCHNFDEVSLGYTKEQAMEEASRCLNCKHKPCMGNCPVNVHIPDFIALVAEGKFEQAYEVIKRTNNLPAICGRVCPQENQCEKVCVRGVKGEAVAIGRLERFCADYVMERGEKAGSNKGKPKGKKVAVIGAGPAGLSCAADLCDMGYAVTIFESLHIPGGVLVYGIPEFRLPKKLVEREIHQLEEKGVEIRVDSVAGRLYTIAELQEMGYKAVFIGTGAGLPSFMKIPGENLNMVFSANEFLTRINLMKAYRFPETDTPYYIGKSCAVIGGGNVAMDAARTAKRLGAEHAYILYRRGEEEMPARKEEIHHAKEEGVEFLLLSSPKEILGDDKGFVKAITCMKMELGEPDVSGRRRPKPIAGSEFTLDVDSVIVAIGQTPNPLIKNSTPGLKLQKWGGIIVDEETGQTSMEGVYAGGDAVSGAATVILAMGAGKKAAAAIAAYLG